MRDRAGGAGGDHLGALRPDEPLDAHGDDVAADVSQEPIPSADEDRVDAETGGSTGDQVEADTEAARNVTGRLAGG